MDPVEEKKVEDPQENQVEQAAPEESSQIEFFKSSTIEQPAPVRAFLEKHLANPYNKYCIDCKKNQTTHAIIWLGIFVCEDCANLHKNSFGGNQFSYVKNVYKEHWDDYQLRSVALGGNMPLFQILKEYGIENEPLINKYKASCVNWYRKRHLAQMDGVPFNQPQPPKDFNEALQMTKS